MNKRTLIGLVSFLLALALAASTGALAQDRDRDRARDTTRDQDRIADRDRVQDRVSDRDRVQDRDQDRLQDRDRTLDRDQLHVRDQDQLRTRDIYGAELMTRQERNEYRDQIRDMQTIQEWARFKAEHQARMMARAREQNVDLAPPLYGQQLMTDQERERLRERLREAESEQARQGILAEHRQMMQERAREHQIPLSELES
jgi:hypothetical protein